jgi:chloride channel 3/4/5
MEEESDNDDLLAPIPHSTPGDQTLLSDDPLEDGGEQLLSFKRKQKQPAGSSSRFLSALTGTGTGTGSSNGSTLRLASPSIRTGTPTLNLSRTHSPNSAVAGRDGTHHDAGSKDGGPLDWYVEGPGRRVGYDDMTAIDWIFEYTKERQRLRVLFSSATGLLGYVQQFLDASQIWVVLILTGLAAGILAAAIDIASDWLGDLKNGYCSSGIDGGHFYLNKYFCCYGYDESSKCRDWVPWSLALHVTSGAGRWIMEYFFFILFSVLFALTACILVQEYALYAKHSGIPEIKTVLGGFVIRRFMSAWTLVIKSLGLVC